MYRLQQIRGGIWSVLDERDEEVFQGSLSGCELWLDGEENRVSQMRARSRVRPSHWLKRLWSERKTWGSLHEPQSASGNLHRS
jgi:hypothetical protein